MTKKNILVLIMGLVLLAGFFTFMYLRNTPPAGVYFIADYESGSLDGEKLNCSGECPVVVTSPVRSGKYAMQASTQGDENKNRTEVDLRLKIAGVREYLWYGFSTYHPNEWYHIPDTWEVLIQWHGYPDFDLGENWRNPPLSIRAGDSNWVISQKWDSKPVTVIGEYEGSIEKDIPDMKKGEWTDWVVHAFFTHQPDGILQVWQNGNLVLNRVGPNYYNDKRGPFLKWGMYNGGGPAGRFVYYDEVRIARGPDVKYEDVAPR